MAESRTITADKLIIGSEPGTRVEILPSIIRLWRGCQIQASLDLMAMGPSLTLYDSHGQERLRVEVKDNGTPTIELNDGNGRARLCGRVNYQGLPYFTLSDSMGMDRLECTLDEDSNEPSLQLFDRGEKQRLELTLSAEGEPKGYTFDDTGRHALYWPKSTLED
jgi:hypothetical protein